MICILMNDFFYDRNKLYKNRKIVKNRRPFWDQFNDKKNGSLFRLPFFTVFTRYYSSL